MKMKENEMKIITMTLDEKIIEKVQSITPYFSSRSEVFRRAIHEYLREELEKCLKKGTPRLTKIVSLNNSLTRENENYVIINGEIYKKVNIKKLSENDLEGSKIR